MKRAIIAASLFLWMSPVPASATELVYTPVNPSFGGNPLNGPVLLQSAQSQDQFKEKTSTTGAGSNAFTSFEDSLNRQILSRLSQRIVDSAFGGGSDLQPGEYLVGGYSISVTNELDYIKVTIVDPSTGKTSVIQVPYY